MSERRIALHPNAQRRLEAFEQSQKQVQANWETFIGGILENEGIDISTIGQLRRVGNEIVFECQEEKPLTLDQLKGVLGADDIRVEPIEASERS